MTLWSFLFLQLIGQIHLAEAVACANGATTTTLSVAYTADGTFTVTASAYPTTASKYCSYELQTWNGATVTNVNSRDECSTIASTAVFMKANITGAADFQYGKTFTVNFVQYSDNTYNTVVCSTADKSIITTQCRGTNYAVSLLSVIKRPFNRIVASVYNKPGTGECYYYVPTWAGAASSVAAVHKSDCSQAILTTTDYGAFAYGSTYTVQMVMFSAGANTATDQPLCGINSVTITPSQCSGSLSAVDSGSGAITVTMPGTAFRQCEVYLNYWAGEDKSSSVLTKSSSDCSSVVFTEGEVATAFNYSLSPYSFEFAEFSQGVVATRATNPTCSVDTANFTFTGQDCSTTTLTFVRPDPFSQSITISPAKSFGVCRITLYGYGDQSVSVKRVGLCTSRFDFITDGTITYAGSVVQNYTLEYFPYGDVSATTTCTRTEIQNTPASSFTCPSSSVVLAESGTTYVFSIPNPRPLSGICKLLVSGCSSNTLTFPSCVASLKLTYDDLSSTPGATCTFKWSYDDSSGTSVCSGSAVTGVTSDIKVAVPVEQTDMQSGQITLTIGDIASTALGSLTGTTCKAYMVGCNGGTLGSPTEKTFTSCSGSVTYASGLSPGDNCRIEVKVLDSSSGVAGTSGVVTYAAAGVPVWSGQSATASMYGDDCVTISWPAPHSTGGAPILCYEVQRKDGAGSYYVVESCSEDLYAVSCGFTIGVEYMFQVIGTNRIGRSLDASCTTEVFKIEWKMSAVDSNYTIPDDFSQPFVAGGFPAIVVQSNNPTSPFTQDVNTTDRLFVARLLSRSKLDSTTGTIVLPLLPTDLNYTEAELPIPHNGPPAFTRVFTPLGGSPGVYGMQVAVEPPSGAYSLSVHSLEAGGLLGQYWANPYLSGSPILTRKDTMIDFEWGNNAIINTTSVRHYDLVSVRWTGFIEAEFSEEYTFVVESDDHVRLWIDDVILINKWAEDDPCDGTCSGEATLEQSTSGSRKFHHVQIDYYHSKGPTQRKSAKMELYWLSAHQPKQIIPTVNLFKGPVILGALQALLVLPDIVNAGKSVAVLPTQDLAAGSTYSIAVTAKDQYGNILQSADSVFTAVFYNGGAINVTANSIPVNSTLENGRYIIPFVLTGLGTWTVLITEAGSGNPVIGSGGTVFVIPGTSYSVYNPTVSGSTVAGSPITFLFDILDSSGNNVDGSLLSTMPSIYISAEYDVDATALARLPVDDLATRNQKYGSLFTDATFAWTGTQFSATMSLYRAGSYDVDFGIEGGAAPTPLGSTLVVSASTVPAGLYAIVTSSPFPPTSLTAGVATNSTVQLRDQYMNPIAVVPTGTFTVIARLQGVSTDVTCTADVSDGQYVCSVTPETAGTYLSFGILVNGIHASFLYNSGGIVRRSQGPWKVTVSAGSVSVPNCILSGVKRVYSAGTAVDATIVLRDASNNVIGALDSYPDIQASVSGTGFTTQTMDTSTFVYESDGTIIVPIKVTIPATGLTLTITVGGSALTLPNGITTIDVEKGLISAPDTACTGWESNKTAGISMTSVCSPEDNQGNAVVWDNIYVLTNFTHLSDATIQPIVKIGTGSSGIYTVTSDSSLTRTGDYSVYTLLCQPGGLIGQYYAVYNFTEIIGLGTGGAPQTDERHSGEEHLYYTRIDPYIDFDYAGPMELGGQTVESVRWSGRITPPATATYTIQVDSIGGVRMQVGSTGYQIDLLSAFSVNDNFNIDLTANVSVPITIEYVVGVPAALSVTWSYAGSNPPGSFVVPPNVFGAPLRAQQVNDLVTILVANISTQSLAYFSDNIVQGQPDFFVIQIKDIYGNSYTEDPTDAHCLATGTVPTCLYNITMAVDDGTVFSTPVMQTDGTFKVPVTFETAGPKQVKIQLINADLSLSHIQGSPFNITVGVDTTP
jgi:hypothetical protein